LGQREGRLIGSVRRRKAGKGLFDPGDGEPASEAHSDEDATDESREKQQEQRTPVASLKPDGRIERGDQAEAGESAEQARDGDHQQTKERSGHGAGYPVSGSAAMVAISSNHQIKPARA
jgi:hypothetical protein